MPATTIPIEGIRNYRERVARFQRRSCREAGDRGGDEARRHYRPREAREAAQLMPKSAGLPFFAISSATAAKAVQKLVRAMADALDRFAASAPRRCPEVPEAVSNAARDHAIGLQPRQRKTPPIESHPQASRGGPLTSGHRTLTRNSRHAHSPDIRRGHRIALDCAFRRHIRSDSLGPYRRRASGAAPLSSGRDSFHSVVAPAAQIQSNRSRRFAHRYAMVALACADHPSYIPSLAEAPADGAAPHVFYSIDTVKRFRREHPDDHLYFILGRRSVSRNSHVACITKSFWIACDFIIAHRPGFRLDALRLVIPPEKLNRAHFARPANHRAAKIQSSSALDRDQPRLLHRSPPAP